MNLVKSMKHNDNMLHPNFKKGVYHLGPPLKGGP